MAVSGRRLGGSAKESDFLYDFPCSPCEKDGRNVEAIKHCADCNENLCSTCLTYHNKFAMMRGHAMSDQVQTIQGQSKQLPSQRCSKHGGNVIDVFCPEHDTVGCSTCISVDHSSCKGKQFISDVASGIKTSKELKKLETEMKTIEVKLESLKKLKGDNLERLKQDKDEIKKEIKSTRKKMNEQLDKMEKQLVDEAEAKFKGKIDAIHASMADVDDMLARVEQAIEQLKSDSNDADIFVSCKIVKQEISNEIHPWHAKVEERPTERSFELYTDGNAKLIMEGKIMFASIKENYSVRRVENEEGRHISLISDETVCTVYAVCALPDGCLVMIDYNNNKLKTLDQVSNKVSTLITLPDDAVGLCLVDKTHLAVSLFYQKKIQFVSILGQVTLENSFSVGDTCRGLAHCDGLLYVCCGGSRIPDSKDGPGHVKVYSCDGELLRCLYEEFGCPRYISVINDGYNTTLYTACRYKGVQVRGIDGVIKHRYPAVLGSNLPFCLIGNDQLCIGERSTGNIYIHTYKDKRILVEKDELNGEPLCLYYDDRSSRLFVGLRNCDVIKVYNLKMYM